MRAVVATVIKNEERRIQDHFSSQITALLFGAVPMPRVMCQRLREQGIKVSDTTVAEDDRALGLLEL